MEKYYTVQKLTGGFVVESCDKDSNSEQKILRKLSEVIADIKEFMADETKTE